MDLPDEFECNQRLLLLRRGMIPRAILASHPSKLLVPCVLIILSTSPEQNVVFVGSDVCNQQVWPCKNGNIDATKAGRAAEGIVVHSKLKEGVLPFCGAWDGLRCRPLDEFRTFLVVYGAVSITISRSMHLGS